MNGKPAWQAEYRRWTGESVGVWTRRLSIARYGLRLSLKGKIPRAFLFFAMLQAVPLAAAFFLFGQFASPDSALLGWVAEKGGSEAVKVINAVSSWLLLYPEICVAGIYRAMFSLLAYTAPLLSVIMVTFFIHRLIAGDVASHAIVIYKSKALTRWDYVLGKFGVVAPILAAIWILPVVVSWMLGNLLSPDWTFFWHSLPALLRGLAVGVVAVVSLSCIALAVSATAGRSRAAVAYWIIGWIVVMIVANVGSIEDGSFALLNPVMGIAEFSAGLYRIDELWEDARGMLPFFDGFVSRINVEVVGDVADEARGSVWLPLAALSAMSAASLWIVDRKVKQS